MISLNETTFPSSATSSTTTTTTSTISNTNNNNKPNKKLVLISETAKTDMRSKFETILTNYLGKQAEKFNSYEP